MPILKRRETLGILAGGVALGGIGTARAAPRSGSRIKLVQWCRSTTGVVAGGANGAVSVWKDLSGQGNDLTQPIASQQPSFIANAVNGLPAVSFDGVSQFLENPNLGEPACEIIVARLRAQALPEGNAFFDIIGANSPPGVAIGAYYLQAMAGDHVNRRYAYIRPTTNETVSLPTFTIQAKSQPVAGPWAIYAVRNDGRTVRLYKSGLLCGDPVPVGSVSLQPITRATVGCGFYNQNLTDFAPVDIAEKISFAGDLEDWEFQLLIDELVHAYDLGVSRRSGDFVWPVFQADGVGEGSINENLVLLQGDGESFRYRPSHYLPPAGYGVRDISATEWRGKTLLAHTLAQENFLAPTAFTIAQSTDGLGTFATVARVEVGIAVGNSPDGVCWAPEFVRNHDNSAYLLNGRPVVLCNISPTPPSLDNTAQSMQYYLFTPSEDSLTQSWTLLGQMQGLPPNILDGFLFYDPRERAWFVSVTPTNPPQNTVLYRSGDMLEGFTEYGIGYDPYGFGVSHEGTSVIRLKDGTERYFLDARGTGYFISDNPGGLLPSGWTPPRPIKAPLLPQHGTPMPTPRNIGTL